mmetsp:Transcript_28125/g.65647  ORF Transcript_28125/g.65647 Transcript_28125/m.65647 type:complete len:228 (-) Transcript_28125:639-1322(-)
MAHTQRQMEVHALDTFEMASGVKSGLAMYGSIFLIVPSLMASLSKAKRSLRNLEGSTSTLALAGPQKSSIFFIPPLGSLIFSGLTSNMMHTASMTILTPAGGLPRDLTSTMSFRLRLLRDATAASRAGSASSRSRCASSAIAFVATAFSLASFSSTAHAAAVISAASLSLVMTTISSSTSLPLTTRTGWSSTSSTFMTPTSSSVLLSLSRPTSRRRLAVSTSCLLTP